MSVEYFNYEGVPGRYFNCAAHKANLSETRCAAMFREAKGLQLGSLHTLERCIGCHVGAVHAGEVVVQSRVRAVGQLTCCRCHCQAARLVCGGICVSCYNREREVEHGRNAKGVPPKPVERFWGDDVATHGKGKVVMVHQVQATMAVAGMPRMVAAKAADTLELMLRAMRNVRDEVFFARRSPVRAPVQLSLWGGL